MDNQIHVPERLQRILKAALRGYELVTGAFALIVLPMNIVWEWKWPWVLTSLGLIGLWFIGHWIWENERRMWRVLERQTPALGFMLFLLACIPQDMGWNQVLRGLGGLVAVIIAAFWYTEYKKPQRQSSDGEARR